MVSTTRMVRTSKVAWSGMSSPLTRLMMFVNDTGIVNESLREWSTTADKDNPFAALLTSALAGEAKPS